MSETPKTFRPDNWGHAARIGLFVVGVEAVPEAEWWAMAPPAVSVHAARVTAPTPWATWDDARKDVVLCDDLRRGADQFAGMGLSAAVVAHSSSSVAGGPGWDAAVSAALQARIGSTTQVTTNGADCAKALHHLQVRRPFLVWPPWFGDRMLSAGASYFGEHGFEPVTPFRHVPAPRWTDVPPEQLYRRLMHMDQRLDLLFGQIIKHCPDTADGILIVGTGFRCAAIIGSLEQSLQRPVVTANQASLWRCLEMAGVRGSIKGYGRLLEDRAD